MSGPPTGTLLDLLEPGWRRHLASGEPATLDVEPEMVDAAAKALGSLSGPTTGSTELPVAACVVVAMAQITAHHDKNGKVRLAWHRATGSRATKRSTAEWAETFLGSLATLGVPAPAGDLLETVLAHAAVTESSLPEFLRLAGAGAPEQELAALDPAVAALLRLRAGTGFVERCRALMELLSENDEPDAEDLADLSLPGRVIDAARTVAGRTSPGPGGRPPLRLDPFGRGVLTRDMDSGRSWPGRAGSGCDFPDGAGTRVRCWPSRRRRADRGGVAARGRLAGLPADRALGAEAPRVLVEGALPLTWNGWRLLQLNLSGMLAGAGARGRGWAPAAYCPRPVETAAGDGRPGTGDRRGAGLRSSGRPAARLPAGDTRWWVEGWRGPGPGRVLGAVEASGDHWEPPSACGIGAAAGARRTGGDRDRAGHRDRRRAAPCRIRGRGSGRRLLARAAIGS